MPLPGHIENFCSTTSTRAQAWSAYALPLLRKYLLEKNFLVTEPIVVADVFDSDVRFFGFQLMFLEMKMAEDPSSAVADGWVEGTQAVQDALVEQEAENIFMTQLWLLFTIESIEDTITLSTVLQFMRQFSEKIDETLLPFGGTQIHGMSLEPQSIFSNHLRIGVQFSDD